eukprot:COSAG02_NODE_1331_length_13215_cov_3.173058_5_plen_168_part_00
MCGQPSVDSTISNCAQSRIATPCWKSGRTSSVVEVCNVNRWSRCQFQGFFAREVPVIKRRLSRRADCPQQYTESCWPMQNDPPCHDMRTLATLSSRAVSQRSTTSSSSTSLVHPLSTRSASVAFGAARRMYRSTTLYSTYIVFVLHAGPAAARRATISIDRKIVPAG